MPLVHSPESRVESQNSPGDPSSTLDHGPSTEFEIYLDWNATSPPHPEVLRAMNLAQVREWANPSSVHTAGRRASRVVERARETTAQLLGVRATDLVFTSGATEANNLALHGAPALVVSAVEHASVTRVAEVLAEQSTRVEWVEVRPDGLVDVQHLELLLRGLPPGALVALTAACHETGVLQPIREVAEIVHRHRSRLHVDAVQVVGKIPPSDWAPHADSLALSVHKVRGPRGIGVLAWRCGWTPVPLIVGGGQQRGLRSGTLDAPLAAGLEAAILRTLDLPKEYGSLEPLRDLIEQSLAEWSIVNGSGAPRLPHVSNLSFPGWYGDELVAALDLMGVCVSAGSACSAGSSEPARAVRAMAGRERARSALRISLGDTTEKSLVLEAIGRVRTVLRRSPTTSRTSGDNTPPTDPGLTELPVTYRNVGQIA
jgi:cysteine desulfurase